MNSEIIDLKEVLDRVQNDRELLIELLDIFLEDCPPKINAIKEAVAKKDFLQLRDIAHSMKGASGNISAKNINASFLQIEQMAKNNDLNSIDVSLKELDKRFEELKTYSKKLKEDLKKNTIGAP